MPLKSGVLESLPNTLLLLWSSLDLLAAISTSPSAQQATVDYLVFIFHALDHQFCRRLSCRRCYQQLKSQCTISPINKALHSYWNYLQVCTPNDGGAERHTSIENS